MSKIYKLKIPLFKDGELEQFDKILDNDLDNIVNKVTGQVLRDKEQIFMQKVIAKQQKEIEKLKLLNNRYTTYSEMKYKEERDKALKVIDKMAERFSKDYCFADLKNKCNRGAKDFSKEKCISCIKDYFYKEIE